VSRLLVAPLLVLVAILAVMMIIDAWLTIAVLSLAYLAAMPFAYMRRRHAPEEPAPATEPG
jgi:phosphatidylserine synthase